MAIYATAKKLVPPSYAEGFDELYDVRIANNSGFEVQQWSTLTLASDGSESQDQTGF